MTFPDFGRSFEGLKSKGFTIHSAEYSGDAFGSWAIEFSSKAVRRHRLVWDGHERWLTLQGERPEGERTVRVAPEQLRRMSYEDGVIAYCGSKADAWEDRWVGYDETDRSLERALKELGSS